jgi:GDPmannose 4,6-dehydratase
MKVLITGVTGQDGSLMADYLLENTDLDIVGGVRRLSVPNHSNISHLKDNPRFRLINLDVTDPESVSYAVKSEKPEFYINFAANSFVGTSWEMPVNHFQTNTFSVLYSLEAIRKYSPATRFYSAGSSEQFGDVDYSPQDINHPFKPRSPYGASKCAAHHLVKVYRESYALYAVQGILFNHEGIRRGEEFVTRKITKSVARIKKAMDNNQPFEPLVLGNLDSKRDWSDAEDFVRGIWRMLNRIMPKDFVLASNECHSIRDFVNLSFNTLGIEGEWSGSGLNEVLKDEDGRVLVEISDKFFRPAEVDLLMGENREALEDLCWEPKTNFEHLVRKMTEYDYNQA